MSWKFWKRNVIDMTTLVHEGDYTLGDIIHSMTNEQLALCFYMASNEYRDILSIIIKNRLRETK